MIRRFASRNQQQPAKPQQWSWDTLHRGPPPYLLDNNNGGLYADDTNDANTAGPSTTPRFNYGASPQLNRNQPHWVCTDLLNVHVMH